MPYDYLIRVRVSQAMAADLERLAASRDTDLCKLLRQAAMRELAEGPDPDRNLREQMLFTALGVDAILSHLDPAMRAEIFRLWQERVLEGDRNA